jgi:cytosine/adenosine deaminase-related metal-dependent hydrolase
VTSSTILYRSPWVVPITSPVIRDGGVLIRGNRIVEVGDFSRLARQADKVVAVEGALMPRLVNCHTHLELSIYGEKFKELPAEANPKTFPDWIRTLLDLRRETGGEGDAVASARELLKSMVAEGVGLVLDTGNLPASASLGEGASVEIHFMLEMLGFTEQAAGERCSELDGLDSSMAVTCHAPYSTHPNLLQTIKKRCRKNKQLFSVHTAESPEEIELLTDGSGPFVDFLKERGAWDGSFSIPGLSPVPYLDNLGLLDADTLCVHCVQVDDRDIELLARSGAGVCLCPESNRTLGVGRAPVEKMLAAGLAPCLGTDSLASNFHCSLWREMQLLSEEHPAISPTEILAAATINGARALGLQEAVGNLAAGQPAKLLCVEQKSRSEADLLEYLVSVGPSVRLQQIGDIYG